MSTLPTHIHDCCINQKSQFNPLFTQFLCDGNPTRQMVVEVSPSSMRLFYSNANVQLMMGAALEHDHTPDCHSEIHIFQNFDHGRASRLNPTHLLLDSIH
jgi:hypothetical protein